MIDPVHWRARAHEFADLMHDAYRPLDRLHLALEFLRKYPELLAHLPQLPTLAEVRPLETLPSKDGFQFLGVTADGKQVMCWVLIGTRREIACSTGKPPNLIGWKLA